MNLYSVRLVVDVVVNAADETEAPKIALAHERDERSHARVDSVERVIDAEKLPPGWDAGLIPWGRLDDCTIGDIIGYPPKRCKDCGVLLTQRCLVGCDFYTP